MQAGTHTHTHAGLNRSTAGHGERKMFERVKLKTRSREGGRDEGREGGYTERVHREKKESLYQSFLTETSRSRRCLVSVTIIQLYQYLLPPFLL